MTYQEAQAAFLQMKSAAEGNQELAGFLRELILLAVRYARARTDWQLADREMRLAMSEARRAAHNAFIDACNILSRACARHGRPNAWRAALGEAREDIGDFACYLHALLGVMAR